MTSTGTGVVDTENPAGPGRPGSWSSLLRFGLIGILGTAAYLVLYLALRSPWVALPAQPANVAARVSVALPTTWLSARYAFGSDRTGRTRLVVGALAALAVGTSVSACVLALEQLLVKRPDRAAEVGALVAANLAAAAARFGFLRDWLSRADHTADPKVAGRAVAARPATLIFDPDSRPETSAPHTGPTPCKGTP